MFLNRSFKLTLEENSIALRRKMNTASFTDKKLNNARLANPRANSQAGKVPNIFRNIKAIGADGGKYDIIYTINPGVSGIKLLNSRTGKITRIINMPENEAASLAVGTRVPTMIHIAEYKK